MKLTKFRQFFSIFFTKIRKPLIYINFNIFIET